MNFKVPLEHLQQLMHIDNIMKNLDALPNTMLETVIFHVSITPGPKTAKKNHGIKLSTSIKFLQPLMHNMHFNIFCCAPRRPHDEDHTWSARCCCVPRCCARWLQLRGAACLRVHAILATQPTTHAHATYARHALRVRPMPSHRLARRERHARWPRLATAAALPPPCRALHPSVSVQPVPSITRARHRR